MPEPRSPFDGRLVRLRAREPGDAELLYRWFNDSEVTRYLSLRYPVSRGTEGRFIEQHGQPTYQDASFAVETLAEGELIGGVGLLAVSPEDRRAELGIAIGDRARWDGGYGTDTMVTVCRFGFEMMNLHRIELAVYAENERARRVYERVGFRVEGVRREAAWKFGRWHDLICMGMLEGELRVDG
jgi:RimJ/RimL family protein N-acetyltransferase